MVSYCFLSVKGQVHLRPEWRMQIAAAIMLPGPTKCNFFGRWENLISTWTWQRLGLCCSAAKCTGVRIPSWDLGSGLSSIRPWTQWHHLSHSLVICKVGTVWFMVLVWENTRHNAWPIACDSSVGCVPWLVWLCSSVQDRPHILKCRPLGQVSRLVVEMPVSHFRVPGFGAQNQLVTPVSC